MTKVILFILLFSLQGFAFDCKKEASHKEAMVKVVCHLEEKEERLELIHGKKGCEFPEGNLTDCLYVVSCKKEGPSRLSSIVFMKDKDPSSFCETPEDISSHGVKKKGRILVQSSSSKAVSYIECSKKVDKIYLKIGSEQKSCDLKFK